MKFLINENFPLASIKILRMESLDIVSVSSDFPSVQDDEVMRYAIAQNRTILTFDSDYGTLIYKFGYRPPAGVIYFRLANFTPQEPAELFLSLLQNPDFQYIGLFTVVDEKRIRQRKY